MSDPYTAFQSSVRVVVRCGNLIVMCTSSVTAGSVQVSSDESRRWGMSPEQWAAARERLMSLLVEAARRRSTVTYGDAAAVAFEGRFSPRSGALMDLLGEVDEALDAQQGVMIASLVVRKDSGMPGEGYFAFARDQLGKDVSDAAGFWESQAAAIWDAYPPEVS